MSDMHCIICNEASKDGGVIRLNETGENGLWACFVHRRFFKRGLSPTTEVLERAMDIKSKMFS